MMFEQSLIMLTREPLIKSGRWKTVRMFVEGISNSYSQLYVNITKKLL